MNKKITSLIIISTMILGLGFVGGVLAYPSRIETWAGPTSHTNGSCHNGGSWIPAVNGTVSASVIQNGKAVNSVQINTKFNISITIANFTDVWNLPDRDGMVVIAAVYSRGDNNDFILNPITTFDVQLDAYGSLNNYNITCFSPSSGGVYRIILDVFNGMNHTAGSALSFIYFENTLPLTVTPLPPVSSILGYIILAVVIVAAAVAVPAIVILRRRSGRQEKPII